MGSRLMEAGDTGDAPEDALGHVHVLQHAVVHVDAALALRPDLIILDLYAKGEMLWDLLLNLKSAYPQIPILIFTASSYAEDLRSHLADAWVRKSFLFEELKQNIRPLLRRSGKAGAPRENSVGSLSEPIAS